MIDFLISKDKKTALITLDDLIRICGHFYDAEEEKGVNVNNGYNCNHPQQDEIDEGCGCCHAFSCPLGVEAELEDFRKFGFNEELKDCDYIVVEDDNMVDLFIKINENKKELMI